MSQPSSTDDWFTLIAQWLPDSEYSWSIGIRGAIAEFHRDPHERFLFDNDRLHLQTARGAIAINKSNAVYTVDCDSSRSQVHFRQTSGIAFPAVIQPLGEDVQSIDERFKGDHLFDLGLTGTAVRACVRTREPELVSALNRHCGQGLFSRAPHLVGLLMASNPHRVFVSPLARIEVYQAIPRTKTPRGPHTHILPEFLTETTGVDHRGQMEVLTLYANGEAGLVGVLQH